VLSVGRGIFSLRTARARERDGSFSQKGEAFCERTGFLGAKGRAGETEERIVAVENSVPPPGGGQTSRKAAEPSDRAGSPSVSGALFSRREIRRSGKRDAALRLRTKALSVRRTVLTREEYALRAEGRGVRAEACAIEREGRAAEAEECVIERKNAAPLHGERDLSIRRTRSRDGRTRLSCKRNAPLRRKDPRFRRKNDLHDRKVDSSRSVVSLSRKRDFPLRLERGALARRAAALGA
jgi:hypothetical protein